MMIVQCACLPRSVLRMKVIFLYCSSSSSWGWMGCFNRIEPLFMEEVDICRLSLRSSCGGLLLLPSPLPPVIEEVDLCRNSLRPNTEGLLLLPPLLLDTRRWLAVLRASAASTAEGGIGRSPPST